jgi:hypothetical protein
MLAPHVEARGKAFGLGEGTPDANPFLGLASPKDLKLFIRLELHLVPVAWLHPGHAKRTRQLKKGQVGMCRVDWPVDFLTAIPCNHTTP